MLKISKSKSWKNLEAIFNEDVVDRYNWFLFEFGKRITGIILEQLLGKLKDVKGTKSYQKRLAIAEIRDKNHRVWWAIAAKVKTLGQSEYDPDKSILEVVPRYKLAEEDPINEILVDLGPWTPETIPFIPSLRQAIIVIRNATEGNAKKIKKKNMIEGRTTMSFMRKHGIEPDPRFMVYQRLRVFPDLQVEALKIEYGLAENSKSHWRPAISFAKRDAIRQMQNEKDLIRAMTDPMFKGYKSIKHATDRMTLSEVRALYDFQTKIRKGSK